MELTGVLHLQPKIRKYKALALGAAFAAPAPHLESVRCLSSIKSEDLKSGASLIPLQGAEDTGDASKAAALMLKECDDEIAVNARKKRRKRLRLRRFSVKLAF